MDPLMTRDPTATLSPSPDLPFEECPLQRAAKLLAERLAELELKLRRRFPGVVADCGLDAARDAGLAYIDRVQRGKASEWTNGGAWLRRVAMRAAFRRLTREPRCVSTDFATFADWPEEAIDTEEKPRDLTNVWNAFESLPTRQRMSVSLHVIEGMSLRQAAHEMGIAPQTVERYLAKALVRLRKCVPGLTKSCLRAGACATTL